MEGEAATAATEVSVQNLINYSKEERGYRIVELGSWKNLKGKLKIINLEKVDGEEEAKKACLFEKPNIVELVLRWDESREDGIKRNDKNVLEGLQPHPNLKMLEIYGFRGTSFPSWTLKMSVRDEANGSCVGLHNLMEIKLSSCSECEEIPMMGHLPHLKALFLSGITNLKSIGASFYGIDNLCGSRVGGEAILVFPALERIILSDMPNLIEWVEVHIPSAAEVREVKVFPSLEYLKIEMCPKLASAPRHEFTCLKELVIDQCNKLECLPTLSFLTNQNLCKLYIKECPMLTEVPDGLHTLTSLEVLEINECCNLKSIAYDSSSGRGGLTSLQTLSIQNCKRLTNLPCEMVESSEQSLQEFTLENLESLMNLPVIIDCLHKMPCLVHLHIGYVPKFIMANSSPLCFLQYLTLGIAASDSKDSFNPGADGILRAASQSSLRELCLRGMQDWETLPDQIQYCTGLTTLRLYNFGIEELPEWLGNLTSLNELCIGHCRKLRRLPPVEAIRRLTNLTRLFIINCPLIKQGCGIEGETDDHHSQWPNISHIPNVCFDYISIRYIGQTEEQFRYLDGA